MDRRRRAIGMRDGYLRGGLPSTATPAQMRALAAYVAAGGSVREAARRVGSRPRLPQLLSPEGMQRGPAEHETGPEMGPRRSSG